MMSNRSSLFSNSTPCQRIWIKALNFSRNLRSIKYSLRKWSIKNLLPGIIDNDAQGENYITLLHSQQGICGKNQQLPRCNVLFKSKKIKNKSNKNIN